MEITIIRSACQIVRYCCAFGYINSGSSFHELRTVELHLALGTGSQERHKPVISSFRGMFSFYIALTSKQLLCNRMESGRKMRSSAYKL